MGEDFGWLTGVVAELRRLGVTEYQDGARRLVLGPEPSRIGPLAALVEQSPPLTQAEQDEADLYAATGMRPAKIAVALAHAPIRPSMALLAAKGLIRRGK